MAGGMNVNGKDLVSEIKTLANDNVSSKIKEENSEDINVFKELNLNELSESLTSSEVIEKITKEYEESIKTAIETYSQDFIENLDSDAVKEIVNKAVFTTEEADTYAKGEAEIQKLVAEAEKERSLKIGLNIPEVDEDKIRSEYAAQHPEYQEVMEEGQKIKADHAEKMAEERSKWIKENPMPELNPLGTITNLDIHAKQMEEYNAKLSEYMDGVEEEYINNNSDYAVYKESMSKVTTEEQTLYTNVYDPSIIEDLMF